MPDAPHCRTIDSPIGPITLVGHEDTLTHVRLEGQAPARGLEEWRRDDDAFADVAARLTAYFAGAHDTFDDVPLNAAGTAFQQRVWAALRSVPFGETRTYGQIAEQIGAPTAFRAVGLANGRNPLCIVVPCHRIVGSGGKLTGYNGGVERKQSLLDLERRTAAALAGGTT